MNPASGGWRAWLPYGLVVLAIWLGWEVVKPVLADRAPVAMAVRVAPGSPTALRRASESELAAGRSDNAAALAKAALVHRPFDARALRVLGLAEARADRTQLADDLLTLAGNWSLRDDPTHGWLVQQRLRQGNYYSAFAHADTLARRRPDIYPQVFNLYATSGLEDPRAINALVRLIAEDPPWRRYFFNYLYFTRPEAAPLAGVLVLQLQKTRSPATDEELGMLYGVWLSQSRFEGVGRLRSLLGRPRVSSGVTNGDFSTPLDGQIMPFGWSSEPAAGLNLEILPRPGDPKDRALLVNYSGYSDHVITSQVLTLAPGRQRLTAEIRLNRGEGAGLVWKVSCLGASTPIAALSVEGGSGDKWSQFSGNLVVPASNCPLQRIDLVTGLADGRASIEAWLDNVKITRHRG